MPFFPLLPFPLLWLYSEGGFLVAPFLPPPCPLPFSNYSTSLIHRPIHNQAQGYAAYKAALRPFVQAINSNLHLCTIITVFVINAPFPCILELIPNIKRDSLFKGIRDMIANKGIPYNLGTTIEIRVISALPCDCIAVLRQSLTAYMLWLLNDAVLLPRFYLFF